MALLLEDTQFNRERGQGPNIRRLQLAFHQNDHGPALALVTGGHREIAGTLERIY